MHGGGRPQAPRALALDAQVSLEGVSGKEVGGGGEGRWGARRGEEQMGDFCIHLLFIVVVVCVRFGFGSDVD